MWASLGDPHRFTHPKQVGRYAGLDPSFVQSGETLRPGRISKNGSTLLRTILVEVALGMTRHDNGPLGQFYHRKRIKIGHKRAAIALARKILIVAWRMLLTGEAYRAIKPLAVTRKYRVLQRLAEQTPPFDQIVVTVIPGTHPTFTRLRHARTSVPA
jgi:hypothetical protein